MSVATICWGLVASLGASLPQGVVAPPKSGNPVPESAAFQKTWNLALGSIDRPHIIASATSFFIASDSAPLSAHALGDAQEVWTRPIHTELPPAVSDDLLFVVQQDVLRALEQSTGRERWNARTGSLAIGPLCGSGWVFVAGRDGAISGLRASDGSLVWRRELGSPASARPAIDGDRLFAPLNDGRLVALKISAAGQVLWTTAIGAAGTEPAAAGGRVYLGSVNGIVHAIRQDDGRRDWPPHRAIQARVSGAPLVEPSRVIVATVDNRVIALDRRSGSILWWRGLPARPSEPLRADRDQLLVPLQSGDVSVLRVKTGQPEKPFAPALAPGYRLVPPLVVAGTPGAFQLLRLTLGPDAQLTLESFKRAD